MTTVARQVMTPNPAWVGEKDTLQQVAARMWDLQVTYLPVCDENGNLRGLITYHDINLRSLTDGGDPSTAVAASLTKDPWATIGVDDPFETSWSQGSGRQAGPLPVLDGQRLVGLIDHPDLTASLTAPAQALPVSSRPVLGPDGTRSATTRVRAVPASRRLPGVMKKAGESHDDHR